MFRAHHSMIWAVVAAAFLCLPSQAGAIDDDGGGGDDGCDCGSGSGCQLLMPETVDLGEMWTTTIVAMPNSVAFLIIAGEDGPTPSKFGPLSIGAPILAVYAIDVGASGCTSFDHLAHCDTQWVGVTAYFQFVALTKSAPTQACVSNAASLTVTPGDCVDKGDFCTFTQGGWGSKCKGNNPGCLRDQWFGTAFPAGLLIGDQDGPNDGDSDHAALFTSSHAVQEFLPAGGTPKALDEDHVNPEDTSAGVFAGQLVAATLNVRFDAVGAFDDKKDNPDVHLADLHFLKGVDDKLVGMTVQELLDLANQVISGELSTPVDLDGDGHGDVSTSDISDALARLNECFDEGSEDQGWLGH